MKLPTKHRAQTGGANNPSDAAPARSAGGMVAVQLAAADVVGRVLGGKNLDRELAVMLKNNIVLSANERQAVHSICFDTLRHYGLLSAQLDVLLSQPLSDPGVRFLLLVALAQLQFSKVAHHMVVDNAVNACVERGLGRAKGLANAVLRNYLRAPERFARDRFKDPVALFDHPRWWINRLEAEYPDHFGEIMLEAAARPPMHLRANAQKVSANSYIAQLAGVGIAATASGMDGISVQHPVPVSTLPNFGAGWVSVQDLGAQLAAQVLDAKDGMYVLDACAAPGGKATHILERSRVHLTALDSDKQRLKQVVENFKRIGLSAHTKHADATNVGEWWDGRPYDRILLDAPCSGSGVTRRHPDIKWIRRESDLTRFAQVQGALLTALWPCLREGGRLLYVTCSVFHIENQGVVGSFIDSAPDAKLISITEAQTEHLGNRLGSGPDALLMPDAHHDGFYYALLEKQARAQDASGLR